ncbi:FAD-dependent thymidylate synthase [Patescibacteria group bacterium]
MVKVNLLQDDPIILAALGVKISQTPFKEGTIQELYEECRGDRKSSEKIVNQIMQNNRHMILADFLPFAITIEDLSRFGAIYLWRNVNAINMIYGAGIEASLRVIKPNRYNEVVNDLGKMALESYERALELGVPNQDARYMLPEGTLTRMIFCAPPRYLVKLANSLKDTSLEELRVIGEKIEALVKKNLDLRIPEETPSSRWEFWGKEDIKERIFLDYQGKIHSASLNMGVRGSLAMYAQLVRQRQFLCDIEPLEEIAKSGRFVVPFTFPEKARKDYKEIARQAKLRQLELIEKKDPNFVYFLLLGQEAESTIYAKGSGILEASTARSEGVAQWEIRNKVGIPITRELAKYKELRKKIGPRCWREGKCIEPPMFKTKKSVCRAFEKSGGKWKGTLEELIETLTEPYETFEV